TVDTLAFGYILPTTGRIPDLHRLETCAAGRTNRTRGDTPHLLFVLLPVLSIFCSPANTSYWNVS
ncbi:MAG: hypothetical protein E6X19_28625, partial [Hungatella hathewayi]|nr:hypothetical protein [Hungatella hathewayi]